MNAEKIKAMIEAGKHPREIAESLGVTIETLKMFCKAKKVDIGKVGAGTWERRVSFKPLEEDAEFETESMPKVEKKQRKPPKKYRERKNAINFNPDVEELRRLYIDEFYTRDKLAEYYDVPRSWVDLRLSQSNIRLTAEQRKGRKGVVKTKEQFQAAIDQYGTCQAVADHFGITYATAAYHSRVYGVTFVGGYEKTTKEMTALAYEFLESDIKKLSVFAKEKNVTYQKLYQICRRLGIDVISKKQFAKRG